MINLLNYFSLLQVTFSPALSREFRPYKPDPAPLLHICSTWGVQPNEVMMVGDSLKDDVILCLLVIKINCPSFAFCLLKIINGLCHALRWVGPDCFMWYY